MLAVDTHVDMAEMKKVDLALKVALSLIILLHCCEGELILR